MGITKLAFAGLLLLACQPALAQDEALIDDLPKVSRAAAAAQAKQRAKQIPAENLPPVTQPNTDLIDDVSPEQKRAAASHAGGAGMRGMRGSGGMMMGARKVENAIPDNLGEALARALHHSPAILVAEAKVRQAQAELNEVRQTVVHDLTLAFKRRARNTDLLPQGSEEVREAVLEDETKILYLLGAVGESRVGFDFNNPPASEPPIAGETSAAEEPRKPANAEAEKPSQDNGQAMAGMMSAMMGMAATPPSVASPGTLDKLPENVRNFLNKRVDLDFSKQPVQDVLEYIKAASDGDVDFVLQNPEEWTADPSKEAASDNLLVTINTRRVTVAAALQALADLTGCAFVFRDYGILVTPPGNLNVHELESYRALGAAIIAPPYQYLIGGAGASGPGMGAGMGPMGGMMGPALQQTDSPANPQAQQ